MLLRYTEDTISSNEDDPGLERKFDVARTGASVFVHGIKNQLLANRVLYKRIRAELDKPEPDMEKLRESTERLNEINDTLIARSEELVQDGEEQERHARAGPARGRVRNRRRPVQKKVPGRPAGGLAAGGRAGPRGRNYLAEALYNLMTNGWESNLPPGMRRAPCPSSCIR